MPALPQRAFCEWLGTAFLLAAVVGSGIMAQKLAGDAALALLCNTLATGAILAVLILVFGPLSGAHFNPAVSIGFALRGKLSYIAAQLLGGLVGVWVAHLMFELPVSQFSVTQRTGAGQWLAEAVATFGLVLTTARFRSLRGRPLYHRGLLVHGFDVLRQPRRHHCPIAVQYLCRDSAGRGGGFRRSAVRGNARRGHPQSLALARGKNLI